MGCILDACEELEEREREQREEFKRTGFKPDCRRCYSHVYLLDKSMNQKCSWDRKPDNCGRYQELSTKDISDRMEEISEKITSLRENLMFLEEMEKEHKAKVAAAYFGICYDEDKTEPDEDDDEDSLDENDFQLPKKMR
jgi:hypothetical protein